MDMNAISRTSILSSNIWGSASIWLDDDSTIGGQIELLYNWYKFLSREGEKFGCSVNGSKSWLIAETQDLADEVELVFREKSE